MTFRKKSWQDYLQASFGQAGQALPTSSDNYLNVSRIGSWSTEMAFGSGDISVDSADTLPYGKSSHYVIKTSALSGTSSGTATIEIVEDLGGTLFSQDQDESTIAAYGSAIPLTPGMTLSATAEGTQEAAGTVSVDIYYER